MGRTLFGIDLDESPLGTVVERVLDEEDLRKLDAVPDGGTSTDGDVAGGDDRSGEPPDSGADGGSRSRSLEEYADESGAGEAGEGDEESGGRLAAVRSRLRPLAMALAGLAVLALVVAVVLWRYGDRIAGAVPGPLGGDGSDERSSTDEFDSATGFGSADESASTESGAPRADREDASADGDARAESDGDLGALVGLAFLAVVAVVVRKLTEEREHDPLVDGETER